MLVSVYMVTFNHEKYIEQAIESVLMQKVDFKYEIIIGEDCSSDKTREAIDKYKNMYPDIIKPIYRDENIGAMKNSLEVFDACSGKYIAMLEGDDYWTDEDKLQIQVDFLENNSEYSCCVHNAKTYNCKTEQFEETIPKAYFTNFKDFDDGMAKYIEADTFFHVNTYLFRNFFIKENIRAKELFKVSNLVGDLQLALINLHLGKFKFIDRDMSVYRINSGRDCISGRDGEEIYNEYIKIVQFADEFFDYKYEETLSKLKEKYIRDFYKAKRSKINKIKNYNFLVLLINDSYNNETSKVIQFIESIKGNFIIYGFGSLGKLLYSNLKYNNIMPKAIIDKNEQYEDEIIKIEKDICIVDEKDIIIVTAINYANEIKRELEQKINNKVVSLEEILL